MNVAQPSCRHPRTRDGELHPAAIDADAHVRRRDDGRMTECARAVPIKADFSRDEGNGFRMTLRTDHGAPR